MSLIPSFRTAERGSVSSAVGAEGNSPTCKRPSNLYLVFPPTVRFSAQARRLHWPATSWTGAAWQHLLATCGEEASMTKLKACTSNRHVRQQPLFVPRALLPTPPSRVTVCALAPRVTRMATPQIPSFRTEELPETKVCHLKPYALPSAWLC